MHEGLVPTDYMLIQHRAKKSSKIPFGLGSITPLPAATEFNEETDEEEEDLGCDGPCDAMYDGESGERSGTETSWTRVTLYQRQAPLVLKALRT